MKVNNQTTDPIDYEQNGSGGNEDAESHECKGTVDSGHAKEFSPCGLSPYRLRVWPKTDPGLEVDIQEITDPKLVVTISTTVT